ncbi:hypothetical protein CPAV1605_799 [seawater metagenome]|uniref:Glycosyl transferase CAP10 domain-containing protein n=1 Tax=seawater metagenome TaxID=1561972 RepID=A0A5E8CK77_9ZZZZ
MFILNSLIYLFIGILIFGFLHNLFKKFNKYININNNIPLLITNYRLYLYSIQLNNFIYHFSKNGSSALVIKNGIKYTLNKLPYDNNSISANLSISGPILNYIIEISKLKPDLNIVIPFSDSDPFLINTFSLYKVHNIKQYVNYNKYNEYEKSFKGNFIILLGSFFENKKTFNNIKKIPFSDKLFVKEENIKKFNNELFKNKIDKIIWRGSTTGGKKYSLRNDVVNYLKYNNKCDVKFSNLKNKLTIYEMSKYKAILIIDGKSYPSSLDWIYRSGSVPISISCWKTYLDDILIPWQDYIPVKTDLSDLIEAIDFVLDKKNIELCQKIIDNGYNKFKKFSNKNNMEKIIKDCIIHNK